MLLMGLFVWTFLRIWSLHYKVGTARLWVPVGTVRLQIYSRYRPTDVLSGLV